VVTIRTLAFSPKEMRISGQSQMLQDRIGVCLDKAGDDRSLEQGSK
jgi:hypothetical protein